MTGREVWVKAKIVEEGDERAARVMTGIGAYERYFWVDKACIHPCTDAAPDALRAACQNLIEWFDNENGLYSVFKERLNALRAALAATPKADLMGKDTVTQYRAAAQVILDSLERNDPDFERIRNTLRYALASVAPDEPEPPAFEGVRVGDRVRIEGDVTEVNEEHKTAVIRVATTGLRTVHLPDLTVVARPQPAHTCGGCRWWQTRRAKGFCHRREVAVYRNADTLACDDFSEYPPKGGA